MRAKGRGVPNYDFSTPSNLLAWISTPSDVSVIDCEIFIPRIHGRLGSHTGIMTRCKVSIRSRVKNLRPLKEYSGKFYAPGQEERIHSFEYFSSKDSHSSAWLSGKARQSRAKHLFVLLEMLAGFLILLQAERVDLKPPCIDNISRAFLS